MARLPGFGSITSVAAALLVLTGGPAAFADQDPAPAREGDGAITPAPVRLDPGYSDINSLQTSLRALPPVMRHDTAFEHIYQSPLDPNQRYRVAGGIYAVFSDSDYIATPYGELPVYPAGVEFHIGPPPGFDGNPTDPTTGALLRETDPRFDLRAADSARREVAPARSDRVTRLPRQVRTISIESFRQQRLREITARALERAGSGDSR